MSLFTKRERYKVELVRDKQGNLHRVLVPKDTETAAKVTKDYGKQKKKSEREERLSRRKVLDEKIRAYEAKEKRKKLAAKEERRRRIRKIKRAVKASSNMSRLHLSGIGSRRRPVKHGNRNYVIRGGKAYPVAKPHKPKSKKKTSMSSFNWSDFTKEFKM